MKREKRGESRKSKERLQKPRETGKGEREQEGKGKGKGREKGEREARATGKEGKREEITAVCRFLIKVSKRTN